MEPLSRGLLAREATLIAGAILTYFGVRNLTAGNADLAFSNAREIVRLETSWGFDFETTVQSAIAGRDALVTLANWVYIWGHWPVILSAALVLFLYRRDHYYLLRNAFFVSGAIGFLFFALLPVAPPRLLDLGLVDTVTNESSAYRALQPPGLTNQYAAFPSLHAGWNVLVGIVLFTATTSLLLRALSVLGPLAMAFAVVATANHFVVDVFAGVLIVGVGLAVAALAPRQAAAIVDVGEGDVDQPAARAVRRRPPRRQPPRLAPPGGAARRPAHRS
jgi:PAP2 superfamily